MKKILSVLLATVMSLSLSVSLFGCNEKEKENETAGTDIVLADFEEWAPDFQLMALYNKLGKVSRNEDEKYVKSGNYSAKIEVVGPVTSKSTPQLLIPTVSERFEFEHKDFSYYNLVSAYMYNANEDSIKVKMGIASSFDMYRMSSIDNVTYTLEPNKWTRVTYLVNLDYLALVSDYKNVKGVYFEFEDTNAVYLDDAKTVYLDDVVIKKAEKQQTAKDIITLDSTDTKKEICDFEKDYQKYVALSKLGAGIEETFETSVVTAKDYGINATSGDKVLRILRHPRQGEATIYNELQLPEVLMKKVGMEKIPQTEEEYKSWYFCFDMYNADPSRHEYMSVWFSQEGYTKRDAPLKLLQGNRPDMNRVAGQWARWHEGMHALCGQWTTYKISLYELTNGMQYMEYVTTPGLWGVALYSHTGVTDWEMFVDNFRLEKGTPIKTNFAGE